jgi:hypothetical protein
VKLIILKKIYTHYFKWLKLILFPSKVAPRASIATQVGGPGLAGAPSTGSTPRGLVSFVILCLLIFT